MKQVQVQIYTRTSRMAICYANIPFWMIHWIKLRDVSNNLMLNQLKLSSRMIVIPFVLAEPQRNNWNAFITRHTGFPLRLWLWMTRNRLTAVPQCFSHRCLSLCLCKTKREWSGSWGAITAALSHEWLINVGLCGVRAEYLRHSTF